MLVSEYNYDLPEERIAKFPPEERGSTRLLVLNRNTGEIQDSYYRDLADFLNPGDVLILNDTRVMQSRLFCHLPDGRQRELVVLEKHGDEPQRVMYRGKLHDGDVLEVENQKITIRVKETKYPSKIHRNYAMILVSPLRDKSLINEDNMKKQRLRVSTTHIILLSFLITILIGAVLLSLPISSADGKPTSFLDALFTATTSTCVTGLVVTPTVSSWSVFGQIIILILIQIGGLGVITIMSGLMILLHKKMGIGDRLLLQDAFNLNSLSGLVRFVKKVVGGTLIIEGIGALLYMTVFIPEFGAKGIWISVFTSVSAFCNAGIDIIAENSLCDYSANPVITFTTCALIVLGGIGYIVWWDVIKVIKKFNKISKGKNVSKPQQKILLCMQKAEVVETVADLSNTYNSNK